MNSFARARKRISSIVLLFALLFTVSVNAQPVISSFSPASGPVGSTITITGSNFSTNPADNIVYFGGIIAAVFTATNTSLTVTVPGSAGYQPISVTVNNLTAYSPLPFVVTFGSGATPFDASSFGPNEGFGALVDNMGVCTADFDGDNKNDVIVTTTPNNKFLAFRNTSSLNTISFAPWVEFTTPASPTQLAAADIDGDGKIDVISLHSGGTVSIYRNTSTPGNLSFAAAVSFTVGALQRMPTVADFDQDGKPDLAIVYSASITLLRNTSNAGTISFAAAGTLTAGLSPNGIASGDLDGDGKPDIAVANVNSASVSVFRNTSATGVIAFAAKTDLSAANGPRSVVFADIDGDSKLDLAVASKPANTVSVFMNSSSVGTISFAPRVNFTATAPESIAASDLDGDGKVDLATPGNAANNISLFKNTSTPGSVSFLAKVDYASGFLPFIINPADLSGDGQPDLCILHGSDAVWVLKNKLPGLPPAAAPAISNVSPASAKPTATLTITGSNFSDASAVTFGGTPAASFVVVSPTTITAVLGLGSPGNVVVTTPHGSASYAGFTFITPAPPTITSFLPGTATANRLITITGTDFYGVTAVSFGGTPATSFDVVSGNTIIARTAYGASGSVSVTTVFGSGTTPGFTYTPPVSVASFSPVSGPAGTTVTISGTNFSTNPADNIVFFGAARGAVTAATATSLTVTVPSGATSKPLSVTTDGFTSYASRPFAITYPGGDDAFEPVNFDAKVDFATTGPVGDVALADFDGDGKPDIMGTNGSPLGVTTFNLWKNQSTVNNITLGTRQTIDAGGITNGILAEDLNGDGKPDMIVRTGFITMFRNTSTGSVISFAPKIDSASGSAPGQLITADLDRDGRPDIISSGGTGFGFSIHRNTSVDGQISISSRINAGLPETPNGVAAGDLDGDGLPDLVTIKSQVDGYITIYKNTSTIGNISFATGVKVGVPDLAASIAIADLDDDNRLDIVVSSYFSQPGVSIFRNTSTGGNITLAPRTDLPRTHISNSVRITDMNGDGKPDIMTCALDSSAVAVYRNTSTTGNISFASYAKYSTAAGPISIVLGDIDGDAKPEIISGNSNGSFNSGTISILCNKTNDPGNFLSFTPASGGYGETITLTGTDFTGATKVSFGGVPATSFTLMNSTTITAVVGPGATGNVAVTLPTGLATKPGFTYIPTTISSFSPAADSVGATVTITGASFNPNPTGNIVHFGLVRATVLSATSTTLTVRVPAGAANRPISVNSFGYTAYSNTTFHVKFPGGFNVFAPNSFAPKYNMLAGGDPGSIACGDLDNDGKADLVAAVKNIGLSVYPNLSTKNTLNFMARYDYNIGPNIISVDIADVNADGKLDLLAANANSQGITVLINNTTPGNLLSFTEQNVNPDPSNPFLFVRAADINRDGKIDAAGASSSPNMLSVFRRTASAGATFIATPGVPLTTSPSGLAAGDIDGDGKADVIILNQNAVSILRNTSTQDAIAFAAKVDITSTYTATGVSIADIDSDGKNDLAVTHYNAAIPSSQTVSVYLNTSAIGVISFAAPVNYALTGNPLGVETGDMNGDGKPDIVLFNETNVVVMKNNSTIANVSFAAGISYSAGLHTSAIAICDFNLDGMPDIAFTDANGNASALAVTKNTFGHPTVTPSGGSPVNGPVGVNVTIDPTVQVYNGTVYVPRHYDIVPEINPSTSTAIVTLYFTQQDFDDFNAHPAHGPNLPANAADNANKANLRVHQYHGFSATGIPGTYSGPAEIIDPDDNNIVWNAAAERWEVTFSVNGFSGFFVSTVGATPLPLNILSFTGIANGKNILLQWTTIREIDVSHFQLERSADGNAFSSIARVNAIGGSNAQYYQHTDVPVASMAYYYRLKMVDMNGSVSYSKIIMVRLSGSNVISVKPNPARGTVTIYHPVAAGKAEITIVDMSGRVVRRINVQANTLQTKVNATGLAAGVYSLVWGDGKNAFRGLMVVE